MTRSQVRFLTRPPVNTINNLQLTCNSIINVNCQLLIVNCYPMRFFLAPLVFIAGILLMKYNVQVTNMTGKIPMAEKYLGTGIGAGTYTLWRLLGLVFCILSVLWLFNMLPGGGSSTPPATPTSMLIKMWF
jgi:hypothetical protein